VDQKTGRALLSVPEALEYGNLGRTMFYRLVAEGQIPMIHIGRCSRVAKADLDAWIDRLRAEAAAPVSPPAA
jgi:excisionase family DNA binding protein